MEIYLIVAGSLMLLMGLAHSVLGEMLIFRHVRRGKAKHKEAVDLLPQRRWDALWSSWHLLTLLGAGLGASLWAKAWSVGTTPLAPLATIAVTFAIASIFWLLGTRGKHPAWIVMAAIAGALFCGVLQSAM